MDQDGYTLVEMLVALVLVGLVMTGAAMSARIVAQAETRLTGGRLLLTDQRQFERHAQAGLAKASLGDPGQGPAVGAAHRFEFPCGSSRCVWRVDRPAARIQVTDGFASRDIRLGGMATPAFQFIDDAGRAHDVWPAAGDSALAAVILLDGARPAVVLRVMGQQPAACNFDAATGTCVETGAGL